jgi:hypothetical protein
VSALRGTLVAASTTALFILLAALPGRGHWAWLAAAALMALLTWSLRRMGICIEADGVRVIALFWSRSVRWEQIDRFVVAPAAGYPFIGHVLLRDGTDLWTFGLSAAGWPRTERRRLQVQRPVDELNRVLAQSRGRQVA